MKHNVVVTDINRNTLCVSGMIEERVWSASPFRWGNKILMKLDEEFYDLFDRGEKITIGRAAKSALSAASIELPEAKLVRPRANKTSNSDVTVEKKIVRQKAAEKKEVKMKTATVSIEFNDDELQSMRLMELLSLAESHSIEVPNGAKKDEIISALLGK